MGQGGVSLRCGSGAGGGLRAARTASHGSHHRRLPGRVCPQELGDLAEKERRLGKGCSLIKLASTRADQKLDERVPSLQLYAEKLWMRFSSKALWPHRPSYTCVRPHTAPLLPRGPGLGNISRSSPQTNSVLTHQCLSCSSPERLWSCEPVIAGYCKWVILLGSCFLETEQGLPTYFLFHLPHGSSSQSLVY